MKTTIQEVLFDLIDLAEQNPDLLDLRIEGFGEFETLGEFIEEQKMKIEQLESLV